MELKSILIVTFLLTLVQQGIACSCNYPKEISKAFATTETVVYGEVVELKITKVSDSMDPDSLRQHLQTEELTETQSEMLGADFLIEAKLKIIELFKGEVYGDTLTLYTTRTGASCGFTRFRIGKQYIIYSKTNSYFFSNFYSHQRYRRLERLNTSWVSSCSISSEFSEDHFNELKKIKATIEPVKIAKAGFNILKKKGLLKDAPKIYTSVFTKNDEGKSEPLEFDSEEIITNIEYSRQDLILEILSIDETSAAIRFKSFDDGGYSHSGTILLLKHQGEWVKDKLNYVSAID